MYNQKIQRRGWYGGSSRAVVSITTHPASQIPQ